MRSTTKWARLAAFAAAAFVAGPALAAGGTVAGKVDAQPPRYLDETVVYLKSASAVRAPATTAMDQKGMKFIPMVLTVTQGDTVEFLNHDGVEHNVYSPDGEAFNLGTFKSEERRAFTFEKPGVYKIKCSIHPEMLGWVFVGQNPYSATVDRTGRYTIQNVPPGTYTLAIWNSTLKAPEKTVTVASGKTVDENFTLRR